MPVGLHRAMPMRWSPSHHQPSRQFSWQAHFKFKACQAIRARTWPHTRTATETQSPGAVTCDAARGGGKRERTGREERERFKFDKFDRGTHCDSRSSVSLGWLSWLCVRTRRVACSSWILDSGFYPETLLAFAARTRCRPLRMLPVRNRCIKGARGDACYPSTGSSIQTIPIVRIHETTSTAEDGLKCALARWSNGQHGGLHCDSHCESGAQ